MGKKKKKNKIAGIIGGSVATIATIGVAVAVFIFNEYGEDVLSATVASDPAKNWTGQKPLRCGGSQEVTLEGRKVNNDKRLFPALISAGGNCVLRIVKCTLSSPKVLSVGGGAKVIIEDSTLLGKQAIYAGGTAKVLISRSSIGGTRTALIAGGRSSIAYGPKTSIDGRKRGGHRILALKEGQDPEAIFAARKARAGDEKRYRGQGCRGLMSCYTDNGHNGSFSMRVTMTIGPDGKVEKTRLRTRRTSKAVKRCLQEVTKGRVLDNYKDPGGTLTCRASGRIMGGAQMVSSGASYRAKKAKPEAG